MSANAVPELGHGGGALTRRAVFSQSWPIMLANAHLSLDALPARRRLRALGLAR